jgi:hypothetical protein
MTDPDKRRSCAFVFGSVFLPNAPADAAAKAILVGCSGFVYLFQKSFDVGRHACAF